MFRNLNNHLSQKPKCKQLIVHLWCWPRKRKHMWLSQHTNMLKTDEVELAVILVGKIVKPQIIWVSSVYICSQHAWKTMDPNDMQHNVYVEIL